MILSQLLHERGIEPQGLCAYRNTLDPRDADAEYQNIDDLMRTNHVSVYERMQDGLRFRNESRLLSFIGMPNGAARLIGYRQMFARRPGIAPGDIVYDPDVAHLFHNFISRARRPMFYDSITLPGLDDLIGSLVVAWPKPCMVKLRPADHAGFKVIAR